jgi:hypothetical protein
MLSRKAVRMRTRKLFGTTALALLAAFGAAAQNTQSAPTQNPTPAPSQPAPSLADAARKARDAKKSEPKNTKVFDNDSIPSAGNINVIGQDAAPADGSAAATSPPVPGAAKPTLAQEEQGWRDRFTKARAKQARDEAELDVLQREMGKLQLGFYPNDPVKQMQQDLTRADIIKQQAKVDKKQAEIAADKAAISDLEDALRKSGGDPGWAR